MGTKYILNPLTGKFDAVSSVLLTSPYLGWFINDTILTADYPGPNTAGDYAEVGSTGTYWAWNVGTGTWVDSLIPIGIHKYTQIFNNAGSWTLGVGVYTLSIPALTHHCGQYPIVTTRKILNPTTRQDNLCDVIVTDTTGDVLLSVPAIPDGRFGGQVIIM